MAIALGAIQARSACEYEIGNFEQRAFALEQLARRSAES
jgi:hypothetical protein